MTLAPVIAISHGGGPMPLLGDKSQAELVKSLRSRVPSILKLNTPEAPRAILLITAHWSEDKPTISNGAKHSLYYDYYGFPPEAYEILHDAPGAPDVAKEVERVLSDAGIKYKTDGKRGWDHGVFVPMKLVDPDAKVPIVQLSVLSSEDPVEHFRFGQALGKLRERNIAIVGSGFASIHNTRLLFNGTTKTPAFQEKNSEWSRRVTEASSAKDVKEREEKFKEWRKWPGAFDMHPRGGAEHFMPLIVCAGAGGDVEAKYYTDQTFNLPIYSYYWE